METLDYVLAWLVYLVAAALLSWVHWKFAKKVFWLDLAYVMQGTLMAVIFTPWYVLSDQNILAPAIIIFVMDIVTIETTAGTPQSRKRLISAGSSELGRTIG